MFLLNHFSRLQSRIKKQFCINQFVMALEQLTSPLLMFQDFMTQINSNLKNKQNLIKLFKEIYSNLFDESSTESQVEWGIIKRNFSKFMKDRFEAEFGVNGKNIMSLAETEIRRITKKLIEKDLAEYSKQYKSGNLGDFSPWLRYLNNVY